MESKQSRRAFIAGAGAAAWAAKPILGADPDLTALTLRQASQMLRAKATSPVELTQACLLRIERYNPAVNAFITVAGDSALAAARERETEAMKGKWRGPLHGIPIALKDNIDTAGIRTTGASELFKDRVPAEDAPAAERLKEAGAILLGKLNMHEFAYGATSAVSYFGPVHNPWDLDRVSGGSSGGSAAAIATALCFGTLGTDTGGSIRIPSSHCGVVGLMPSYGRVSNRGVIPMAWTLDHVGPICKTVEDAALMLTAIAGYDELDPTTIDAPVPDYTSAFKMRVSKLRIGLPRAAFFENLDPEYAKAVESAIEVLRKMTAATQDVQLPPAVAAPLIWGPETYAYHAKWLTESPEKYQAATRAQMIRSNEVKPDVYASARRQVDLARREIRRVFERVDVLVTPTMKVPPAAIAASLNAPAPNASAAPAAPAPGNGGNPWAFDVYGLPAITLPCGFTSAGLPIGLEISAAPFSEKTMLAVAHAYEEATDWHTRRPSVRGVA
ncbi:MAG: amidase [Acidobacteriia bacterium]|nr:amidase [Terriglobia bacterium]